MWFTYVLGAATVGVIIAALVLIALDIVKLSEERRRYERQFIRTMIYFGKQIEEMEELLAELQTTSKHIERQQKNTMPVEMSEVENNA